MTVNVQDLESHPALKGRQKFVRAMTDFSSFLEVTKADLQSKKEALENERRSLKSSKSLSSRRIRNYLSCQLFMLRKHFSRLVNFEIEIESRLNEILRLGADVTAPAPASPELDSCDDRNDEQRTTASDLDRKLENLETEISLAKLELNDDDSCSNVPEIVIETSSPSSSSRLRADNNNDDDDLDKIETVSSHSGSSVSGSSSIYPVSLGNEDSFDSSVSTSSRNGSPLDEITAELHHHLASTAEETEQQVVGSTTTAADDDDGLAASAALRDQQLLQLLADMNKMKRRCKHILDVTDRYCTLRPDLSSTCEPDSGSPVPPLDSGIRSGGASPDFRTPKTSLPDPISQRLLKTTLESLGSHISVIAKTYTKRHSTEPIASPNSPTGIAL